MYLIHPGVSQTPCVSARHSDVYLRHFGRLGDAWVSLDASEAYRRRPAAYPRHIGCMADAMYRRHHLVYLDTPGRLLYIAKCIPYTLASGRRCRCLGDAGVYRHPWASGRHVVSTDTQGCMGYADVSRRPRVYPIHSGVFNTPYMSVQGPHLSSVGKN